LDKRQKHKATVYLYSGRSNPEWEWKKPDHDKLLLLFQHCKPVAQTGEQHFVLGYSGCGLTIKDARWHVWKGLLSITRKGETLCYEDKDRLIEKLILRTAPAAERAIIREQEPGLV